MTTRVSPESFATWAQACTEALGAARAEIDALNVFPVPDSDTGTNAYLTFDVGRSTPSRRCRQAGCPSPTIVKAYVDGAPAWAPRATPA